MNRLIIDARSLDDKPLTGVGRFTYHLIDSIPDSVRQNSYLFVARHQQVEQRFSHWPLIRNPYPSKVTIASTLCNIPICDRLFRPSDSILMPNNDYLPISYTNAVHLIVHDFCWKHWPQFFSLKGQYWHNEGYFRRLLQRATNIICVSRSTASECHKYFPDINPAKITVIYPGVESVSGSEYDETNKRDTLLFIGTNEVRKNVASVLKMWSLIADLDPSLQLVIVGKDGWQPSYSRQERVKFLHYIDDSERSKLLRRTKIFVWPSFYEGFGFPLAEASQLAIPIVTSFTTSMPEIMKQQAFYCNPWNYGELAAVIRELLMRSPDVAARQWPQWSTVTPQILKTITV